jgi:tripartite-type tricarboxylate transporter receptor subunit TctC
MDRSPLTGGAVTIDALNRSGPPRLHVNKNQLNDHQAETVMPWTSTAGYDTTAASMDIETVRRAARRAVTIMAIAGLALSTAITAAHAQTAYPERTVKLVVGFPAGTTPDSLARMLADRFQVALGQPFIVENAVGAGGNIAAHRVARAEPDGHTLLLAGNASLVVNQSLYEKLPFDPAKDFAPVSQIAITPNLLVVHPDVQAKSVAELAALARKSPDDLAYAHVGVGTSQHLAAELFKHAAGIGMRAVAYRGGNTALPDLIANRVQVCFCNIATTLPLIEDGKLRALAITSSVRSPSALDIPTMEESGFTGFKADAWFGLVAPAAVSPSVIKRLNDEVVKLLAEPSVRKTLSGLGMVPVANSAQEFSDLIHAETRYWDGMIARIGLKVK